MTNIEAPAASPALRKTLRLTDHIILFSLLTYAAFAPHSIAVTQGAFLLGLLAWGVQLAITRDFRRLKSPIDLALLGFFACSVISSFVSYDPMVSIKGLRSPAFFLAFYFVMHNVRSLRLATLLGALLIGSCLVNTFYSVGQVAVGRGVRIDALQPGSALARGGLQVGDVLMEANRQPLQTAEDLSRIADNGRGRIQITYQRGETLVETQVSRRAILKAPGQGAERLGIETSPGRHFRVSGFYSHYETYAEVLQLIGALAAGLLIAFPRKRSRWGLAMAGALLLITGALFLTSTRAAMAGLAVAVALMAVCSARQRTLAAALLAIMFLAPVGLLTLERSRGVALFDPTEGSTAYRLEVWREALWLIQKHPLLGIGKGSEAKLKDKLGLYDNGRLPSSHFHSTPIQIATWWGLPALAFYMAFMAILFVEMWRLSKRAQKLRQWQTWGLALGGLGTLAAFNVSSVVHFNFGDGEVVMVFWLVTGLTMAVRRQALELPAEAPSAPPRALPATEGSDRSQLPEPAVAAESRSRAAGAKRN